MDGGDTLIQHILPTPKKVCMYEGETRVKPAVSTDCENFLKHLAVFCDAAEKMLGIPVIQESGGIRVCYDANLAPDAYTFDSREGVVICASDVQGLMYGLATALFALEPDGEVFT